MQGSDQSAEDALFREAIRRAQGPEREAFLAEACAGNEPLREKLNARLHAHEGPAPSPARPAQAPNAPTLVLLPDEISGARIGHYRLHELIGEGGGGAVYLAEQEEPVRRRVALKILKLGMDTRQVIARFEVERQALALMDHPNIAKVFDAGATATGRPYFVMELVRGPRITDYCDQNRLSTEARLKLFLQVCHAIQHAHQKGVIHRDIKPSNILVTLADDLPVPKMIDFGIAKAVGERLTDKTLTTGLEPFIGTPDYMSPEQTGAGGLDIDTRSDIYALGVLLYELLTGRTPFEATELRRGGLADIIRRIREEEPPTPSTRVRRLEASEQVEIAQHRGTDAAKLFRSLRGELDWIVMKCLDKDRARRYDTAKELARDIECQLLGRPVGAAAQTLRYQTVKFVHRHRAVLATAAALVLMALVAASLSLWQARRAHQAEEEKAILRNAKWALETAMPELEGLLERDDYTAAFGLVERAQPFIGDNPRFQALRARVVRLISFETTPPGAQVFIRDYADLNPVWKPIGSSPLKAVKVSWGFKRWKLTLPGYEPAEGALLTRPQSIELRVKLDRTGSIPSEMVRIPGEMFKANLRWLDAEALPTLTLPDFLLDRFEVTNGRFREFVEAGGYQRPEYWKHKFIKDGVELSWAAAMQLFVDQTGRPGPATWRNGTCPKDQEEHPVGGVSWYEAAAYAEFEGKCLPTVYHWSLAAGDSAMVDVGYLIPQSNFGESGPAAGGTFRGITAHGIYDMAGNLKEWCFNDTPEGFRVIAGGAWNEPEYMFHYADKYPPFFRGANFGFRCMKLLADDGVWQHAATSVRYNLPPVLGDQKPCSDEVFEAYRKLYDYNKTELQPQVEATEDLTVYTRRQKVSFNAAYGNERVIAYLHLPRVGKAPFQTMLYFPGDGAWSLHSVSTYGSNDLYDHHTKHGRALVFPVMHGTFERRVPREQEARSTPLENWIMCVRDFRRTIDYLETRPREFDLDKLAYEGLSRGGVWGGIVPAIDRRIKVVVMFGGGVHFEFPPEYSQVNFAPRIKIPILLQNGRYDFIFPVETNQKPFLSLFGTPEKDKHFRLYEAGHSSWLKNEVRRDELAFLDKYLGPVK